MWDLIVSVPDHCLSFYFGMYPSISKCNAKRCNCCMHLYTNSIVTSSMNGRNFQSLIILKDQKVYM